MASSAAGAAPSSSSSIAVDKSFQELDKQRELITACTHLWKELTDHFSTLEKGLQLKSESLRSKRLSLDASTRRSLDSLDRREISIDASVDSALSKVDEVRAAAMEALAAVSSAGDGGEASDLVGRARLLCAKMDSFGFFDLLVEKRKEVEVLRTEMPAVLGDCVDPGNFVLDAISRVFPVDKREVKVPSEVGWVCVLVLESLVPVIADPELGSARPLVTRCVKDRAVEMAAEWKKDRVEQQGGIEGVKPTDAHAFLQHVVTFGIVCREDKELYKSLVISFAWRKQMPKLAISLGLDDQMEDIIEELIGKGHQLDAINFVYEAGLQEKFPPIPLIKSFLKDTKTATISTVDDNNNPGQAASNNNRKEQSVIRAAIKCIQDHNLEADFPLENLHKRLEQLEKVKQDKKRPSVGSPATKRTRASNGGPMPPAKAGRLTHNAYVSSFPAVPAFVRSPSAHTEYATASPPYAYDRPVVHGVYGSRSPPAIREPYAYPPAEVAAAVMGAPYHSPPMSYPAYGSYNNPVGGYNNGMAPGYQQAYYR